MNPTLIPAALVPPVLVRRPSARDVRRPRGAVSDYLRDLDALPARPAPDRATVKAARASGDPAQILAVQQRLVESALAFAVKLALPHRERGLPVEDLINAANLGLIEAAERYDPDAEAAYLSYARWWIMKEIGEAIQGLRVVRPPKGMQEHRARIAAARAAHRETARYDPTMQQIAERSGLSLDRVASIQNFPSKSAALDFTARHRAKDAGWVGDAEAAPCVDAVGTSTTATTDSLQAAFDAADLHALLDRAPLTTRERAILRLHFGMGTGEAETLVEIGARYGITRERVRQIKDKALQSLRAPGVVEEFAFLAQAS